MEENLLNLLKKNPEKGLEKLMKCYGGFVYTIAYHKLYSVASKEDIEECVSSVFYEVFRCKESIDLKKGSLKAFLSVIAKRTAIDLFRKKCKSLSHVVSMNEEEYETVVLNKGELPGMAADLETKTLLVDSIKAMGEPDNQIFIRKFYFGQSSKEISKVLGIKENTIDKKVSRGIIKLREVLGGIL